MRFSVTDRPSNPESQLADTATFDAELVDLCFGPDEGFGILIVGLDEGIEMLAKLSDGVEGRTVQRLALQDREPDLHLVKPRGSRWREVELHVRVTLEPAVIPGLVGIEVVENDVDIRVRVSSNDAVHKVEKFDTSAAIFVSGHHLPSGHFEGGKQGRGAIALVVMATAGQRPPAGKLEMALRPFQSLDRWFFRRHR